MRGRVMALYSMVFLGSTPIGGPIAGWLSEAIDPRAALVLAGVAGVAAAIGARAAFRRLARPTAAPRLRATALGSVARPGGGARTRRPLAPAAGAAGDPPARDRAPGRVSGPA